MLDTRDYILHHIFRWYDDRSSHLDNVHNYCYSSPQNIPHCMLWQQTSKTESLYCLLYWEQIHCRTQGKKNLLFTSCNLSFFFKSFNFILKTQNIKKNQNLSLVHCKKLWTKIHKITFLAINSSPSWFTSVIAYATHFVAAFTSCFARFNTIWTKVTIIAFWKRYTHVM